MFRRITLSAIAAVAIALPNFASAGIVTVFDYDFSAGDGFVDGPLSAQNGHAAQGQYIVGNSAGTGEVTAAAPAFQRFSADGNLIDWAALNVGDMVVLDMFDFTSSTGTGAQLGVLGLTTLTSANGENPGGSGNSQLGGQITSDGTNYFLDEGVFAVSGGAVDTGIALGTAIDYQVKLTKLSATTADVLQTIQLAGGGSAITKLDTGVADATNGAANIAMGGTVNLDDNVAAIFQTQNGQVGPTSIGGWSANIVAPAIPEPSSIFLIGLTLAGAGLVRRR